MTQKNGFLVIRNGQAQASFYDFEEAKDYIAFFSNHDKTAKPDRWFINEYTPNCVLLHVYDFGDGHWDEI